MLRIFSKLFPSQILAALQPSVAYFWFSVTSVVEFWGQRSNSDVEQQNYYLKREATKWYFASVFSDKGGPVQKKEEINISKKAI